jgi:DNA modification methylase
MDLRNGDCLQLLKSIPDKSVDLFICDLPYGETNCSWDSVIDLKEFWKEFKRIRKSKKTACIHFCSTKFGHTIINSNPKMFKMDMVWKKRNKTGGLQSRYRPMRNHEMVYFFYEQAPKYNRDKYHKRIRTNFKTKNDKKEEKKKEGGGVYKIEADMTAKERFELRKKNGVAPFTKHEPPNPSSIIEEGKDVWGQKQFREGGDKGRFDKDGNYTQGYEPPNPPSVLEEETVYSKKGWNSGDNGMGGKKFKNKLKENGEASYHEPLLPTSVLEEQYSHQTEHLNEKSIKYNQDAFGNDLIRGKRNRYEPPTPATVIEETGNPVDGVYNKAFGGKGFGGKNFKYIRFTPAQPGSVIEDKNNQLLERGGDKNGHGWTAHDQFNFNKGNHFEPQQPASIIDEIEEAKKVPYNDRIQRTEGHDQISKYKNEYQITSKFNPSQPGSVVVEEGLSNDWNSLSAEEKERIGFEAWSSYNTEPELPGSVYESSKCFVGKRNHQTEKPIDILSFFIKYYSDEGDTILDPTMGSGSTGVACKQLNRKFIGFEMNDKIFEVAKDRIDKAVKIL